MMLTVERIRQLFAALNDELTYKGVQGELYLAGGAVMCLVFQAREATKDIDALLVPASEQGCIGGSGTRRLAGRLAE